MMAAVGIRWHANATQAAEAMAWPGTEAAPDAHRAARYNDYFAVYANLYPRLRPAYAELAALTASEDENE
jgi:sugar (pentulose or hexulose) kinase